MTFLQPQTESLKSLAHLGDAVWELFVREWAIKELGDCSAQALHAFSIERAKASFQAELLQRIEADLTEAERDLIRRGRNISITQSRKAQQGLHRQATAFESLLGYWYLHEPERLSNFIKTISTNQTIF